MVGRVKPQTYSINLLHLVRIIAVTLLILFFLPWIPPSSNFYTMSGASFVLALLLVFNSGDVMNLRYLLMLGIIGLGFIPVGTVLILISSYAWRFPVSLLCILTGIIGIVPFVVAILPPNDIRKWYFPMILTPVCLLALIVVGALWRWKHTNTPADRSGKLATDD